MTWEPRASERPGARAKVGLGHASPRLVLAFALAFPVTGTLGACRQTVVLDPLAGADGGAGAGGPGPVVDAGPDIGRNGGGNRFDGGHPDLSGFCQGGQIARLQIMMRTPDVIISVDRSASMQAWFGTGTRLQVIQQQVKALIDKYAKHVFFGYQEFPSPLGGTGSMGMGTCGYGQGCCAGDVTPPTYNNVHAIERAIGACDNNTTGCVQPQRPIGDALAKCARTFSTSTSMNDTGHRYVLLLTGGDPNCQGPDPMATPCDNAVTQVTQLRSNLIDTAVFGVGDGAIDAACLDSLASLGGFDTGGPLPYHLAKTPTELSASLAPLIDGIAQEACTIDVLSPPADPSNVALFFDGLGVPVDAINGWDFDRSNVTLTVHGTYCTAMLKSNQVELVSTSGCPSPHN
jgi:hypothetical protein